MGYTININCKHLLSKTYCSQRRCGGIGKLLFGEYKDCTLLFDKNAFCIMQEKLSKPKFNPPPQR